MTPARAVAREIVAKEVRTILSRWIMLDRAQLERDLTEYIDAALQAREQATWRAAAEIVRECKPVSERLQTEALVLETIAAALAQKGEA